MKEKGAVYLPHTAGRYAAKRFRKSQVSSKYTACNLHVPVSFLFSLKSVAKYTCSYLFSTVP